MDFKIYTEKSVLDLSNEKLSIQENNSKVSDQFFTKFLFPFEVKITENIIEEFGDYLSYDSFNLNKIIPCKAEIEGNFQDAKLEILKVEGNTLVGQLDFGFDEIPNFDKPLKDFDYGVIEVEDIHTYAADICKKKYPETNFNFPRIYTKKYSPSDKMWDAFDGYYNDTVYTNEGVLRMRENIIYEDFEIDNVNIIHPCPHILYLIKKGFEDVGLILSGDILTDKNLEQRWVFSGGQYFDNRAQVIENLKVDNTSYDSIFYSVEAGKNLKRFTRKITIKKNEFKLFGKVNSKVVNGVGMIYNCQIKLNNQIIHNTYPSTSLTIEKQFTTLADENTLEIIADLEDHETLSQDSFIVFDFSLKPKFTDLTDINATFQETGFVKNENAIDLKKAVPDITFGELITIIKNWFNYDIVIKNKTVFMNKNYDYNANNLKSFEDFQSKIPSRKLINKKSYQLKFTDLDGDKKLDYAYYDQSGFKLNGLVQKDSNVIEINGYPMPIGKPKQYGHETAIVMKDSDTILALVYYDGLINGSNNAKNPPGCEFPQLFVEYWEKWLQQRVNSTEFNWKFTANIEELSQYSIKDYIFAYQNIHIIKSWTKDKISKNTYEVDIITETIY